jgi:hypothetical protein
MLSLERDNTGIYITNRVDSIYITKEELQRLKEVKRSAELSPLISQKICDNKKERQLWSLMREKSSHWSKDLKDLMHQIKNESFL